MWYWAILFLIVTIVAGLLGFGVIAFGPINIARVFFAIFLVLFAVTLIGRGLRRWI